MKIRKRLSLTLKFPLLTLLSLAFLVSCSKESTEEQVELSQVSAKASVKEDFMIILKNEAIPDGFSAAVEDLGASVTSTIPEIGLVTISAKSKDKKKIEKMSGVRSVVPNPNVKWVEPGDFHPAASPLSIGSDEPFFDLMWGMDAIDAPEAWNTGYTGSGVRVAILDSGIDAQHPDLTPNLNAGLSASFIDGEDWRVQPGFYFNHGTHVAGTIAAADNEYGVIGVAPNAEIVAVKVLSEFTGSGPFSSINAGIIYAADIDSDVINMSLGADLNKNGKFVLEDGSTVKYTGKVIAEIRHAQQRAINYAHSMGTTVVVAAGNDYTNADGNGSQIFMPAEMNNTITVSATAPYGWAYDSTTDLDVPSSYTNYGKSLVDISAPGGDFDHPGDFWYYDMVLSTIPGGWSWSAGTSMASPHVAGVAALIIEKNGGDMSPKEVAKQLYNTADKVDGNGKSAYHGKGRVNAYRAVTE